MAYRASLAALAGRVRELIYDTGGSPTWSNDQVAGALDQHRRYHNNEKLRGEVKLLPGGVQAYREHFSEWGYWESDAVVRDATGATLTPDTGAGQTDYLLGYFYFGSGQNPPVYIDGKTYDVYAAAVDLLEEWLAAKKNEFDFTSAGSAYGQKGAALSQVFRQYQALVKEYRARAQPSSVRLVR